MEARILRVFSRPERDADAADVRLTDVAESERELVLRAASGESAAAEELFERHWAQAWRVAVTLTREPAAAEDVVQDAFERAFRSLGRFNGRSTFGTWLHRIVVNRALDVARRERRREPADVERSGDTWSEGPDTTVRDGVDRLPPERRLVIVLRYWLDFTPTQIAEILEVPVGTVHSRLARGLDELRDRLEGDR
jgi:RNA polymerase sigma-70 factor (ECF subfamily)